MIPIEKPIEEIEEEEEEEMPRLGKRQRLRRALGKLVFWRRGKEKN